MLVFRYLGDFMAVVHFGSLGLRGLKVRIWGLVPRSLDECLWQFAQGINVLDRHFSPFVSTCSSHIHILISTTSTPMVVSLDTGTPIQT